MVDLAQLITDLDAESAELDHLAADADWALPTPAPGWTIAHQISHLAWTDAIATLAVTDPEAFRAVLDDAVDDPDGFTDRAAMAGLAPKDELLARWRAGRARLGDALRRADPGAKIIWFGPAMTPATMVTSRLMEAWAHGQDIADALGATRGPTDRLRHVAHLGFRTLGYSFLTHGRPAPTEPVRVELTDPTVSFGPPDAANRLTGPALDFCLLVTQRRHHADLALTATGPVATEWLDVAQAFAGPPGTKRGPRS